MRRIHDRTGSFWAILLLVLAVSPVTAPFSSCDLEHLFSERAAHPGAILQAQNVQDKTVGGVTDGFVLDVRHAAAPEPSICAPAQAPGCARRQFPLRI